MRWRYTLVTTQKSQKNPIYYRGVLSRKIDFREGEGEGEGVWAHLGIGQKSLEIPYTIGAFCEEKSTFGGKSARYYSHNLSEKSTCQGGTVVIAQKSRKILYTIGAFCEEKTTFGGGGGGGSY